MANFKFPSNTWRFEKSQRGNHWQTYRLPLDWPEGLYGWLWDTFGHPGYHPDTGKHSGWDFHGGWIYFFDEEYVVVFLLRWS
jgi:hypothetical protein